MLRTQDSLGLAFLSSTASRQCTSNHRVVTMCAMEHLTASKAGVGLELAQRH